MSCCGNKRNTFRGVFTQETTNTQSVQAEPYPPAVDIFFEYRGEKRLTVLGASTGRRYSFDGQGVRLAVAAGDVAGMMGVPGLYRVRKT
ncbi:MAG: hypothetical protein IT260_19675 [Saprospiraceae bacterium]|nr:hypothetical protein [Saprospiraceae bacterium]